MAASFDPTSLSLTAACAFGLEAVVRRELESLGIDAKGGSAGQVLFQGGVTEIAQANLWLRCADRVRIRLAEFPAPDFDALFDTLVEMEWASWLPAGACFPVNGRSLKSALTSVPAIQRTVKKAVVTALQKQHGTSSLPETGPTFPIEIALLNDQATVSLDTTGTSLHKRGYRQRNGPAPLKETLAAALVQLSFWRPDRPLIDPFCGTGTIPIEAAMLARRMAPGLNRSFQAEEWPWVPSTVWTDVREAARAVAQPDMQLQIIGTDRDGRVLSLARDNARSANVESDIHFQEKRFQDLLSQRPYGCIVTNPPYGSRIGETTEVEELHRSMPEVLSRLKTWSHFILTPFPNFERHIQKKADRRRKLFNGRIECTYFQFHGPRPGGIRASSERTPETEKAPKEPPSGPTAPVFGGLGVKADEQAELFQSRLKKRARHFRRWPTRKDITCFRLYDRDIPEIPLVVDRIEDHLHIVEYERPHDRDLGQHAQWLERMAKTAATALEVPRNQVFLKQRRRQRGNQQHSKYDERVYEIVAHEGGLKFWVNLSDYADTGLFLDHRVTREMIRDEVKGKRFLNLFAYTGSFTVYAADGAAASTTSVDLSSVYLDWARRNLDLNQLNGPQHEFVRSDILTFLRQLPRKPLYDVVVIDPPTFSNSKRTDEVWDVQRDHEACLSELLERVEVGGRVYFSTNFRKFKFDPSAFPVKSVREISRQTVPEDFRNQRIHRCWLLVR